MKLENSDVSVLIRFTMTTKSKLTSFIILVFCCHTAFAQVGDSCVVKSTGLPGICRVSSDCPVVQEQAQNGISPTICGFLQLTIPIVCCERNSFVEPNDDTLLNREPNPGEFVFPDEPEDPPPQILSRSEQKCQEYSKAVTDVVQAIPLVTHTEAISIPIVKCDYNGVALIVGGKPAAAGEFPFMAAVGFLIANKIEWRCGGTLVSEQFVLTAAHCTFTRERESPKVVRLGELDLTSEDDGSVYVDYNIRNIIVHPKYRFPQKYNDIALLRTASIVRFSKFIRPACLYTKTQVDQPQAIATGWGKTDYAAAEISDKLRKVSLNIYDNSDCSKTYTPSKYIPQGIKSNMLCAGELRGEKDTCQGDSGGPLLITKKGNQCTFYIVGITSFGRSCGEANTPAIYTRVSEYVPWIEKTIW